MELNAFDKSRAARLNAFNSNQTETPAGPPIRALTCTDEVLGRHKVRQRSGLSCVGAMDSTLEAAAARKDDSLNPGGEDDGDDGPTGVPALV